MTYLVHITDSIMQLHDEIYTLHSKTFSEVNKHDLVAKCSEMFLN